MKMRNIFDLGDTKEHEKTFKKTWAEFRNALANNKFTYDDIEAAKKY